MIEKTREFQKNIYFCFIYYAKVFVWITTNWEIIQEMGIPDHLTRLPKNLYAGQEATVRTGHGRTDWSKSEKEYVKAIYCHPVYLTSMQSTSCEMLGWMKHCCSHALQETNSLRRTMQIVEGSLLHRQAQGRISS